MMWSRVKDPRMKRREGKYVCAECGEMLNDVTVKNEDPFCSTGCCHAYHGIEITVHDRAKGVFVGSSS